MEFSSADEKFKNEHKIFYKIPDFLENVPTPVGKSYGGYNITLNFQAKKNLYAVRNGGGQKFPLSPPKFWMKITFSHNILRGGQNSDFPSFW